MVLPEVPLMELMASVSRLVRYYFKHKKGLLIKQDWKKLNTKLLIEKYFETLLS